MIVIIGLIAILAAFLVGYFQGEDKGALKSKKAYDRLSQAYEKEKIEHLKLKRMIGADDSYRAPALIDEEEESEKAVKVSPELLALMAGTAMMLPLLSRSRRRQAPLTVTKAHLAKQYKKLSAKRNAENGKRKKATRKNDANASDKQ